MQLICTITKVEERSPLVLKAEICLVDASDRLISTESQLGPIALKVLSRNKVSCVNQIRIHPTQGS